LNLPAKFPKLRPSECVLAAYFAYVAILPPFFPDRPHLKFQPLLVLLAVTALLALLAAGEQRSRYASAISYVRDWLPIFLTVAAFREMEFFLPAQYSYSYELTWARQDHWLLTICHARALIETFGTLIPFYLELCYLLVYGLPVYCIGLLYTRNRRNLADLFLVIYLTGTLASYALFPYFPSQPPRIVFPRWDDPSYSTCVRHLNLYVLRKATIHVGVFPSAHVSSAFSAAWAMFLLLPQRKVFGSAFLFYAISVSVATIYGRYHYSADVLSGFAVSLLAGSLCLLLRPAPLSRI